MKVSSGGRAAIMLREGCRLAAYRDSVGILTIGVGHTGRMSPPQVTARMRITTAQADAFLAADLAPVEATINDAVKVPLSQNEFDALASLGFNIGIGGLRRSTVIARLNRGDRAGAAQAFLLWAHPPELMGRRRSEVKQFQTPYVAHAIAPAPVLSPSPVAPIVAATPGPASAPTVPAPAPKPSPTPAPARRAAIVVPAPVAAPASPGFFARVASLFGR